MNYNYHKLISIFKWASNDNKFVNEYRSNQQNAQYCLTMLFQEFTIDNGSLNLKKINIINCVALFYEILVYYYNDFENELLLNNSIYVQLRLNVYYNEIKQLNVDYSKIVKSPVDHCKIIKLNVNHSEMVKYGNQLKKIKNFANNFFGNALCDKITIAEFFRVLNCNEEFFLSLIFNSARFLFTNNRIEMLNK